MELSRVVLLRQPAERVWNAFQDDLPSLAPLIPGIESIRRLERTADGEGIVHTVHEWVAAAGLPAPLRGQIDPGALTWIERGAWNRDALEARWTVESLLMGRSLSGSGVTRISRAMGGQGTRVHFEVAANLAPDALGPLGGAGWRLADAAAMVLTKTLQDLCVAVDTWLRSGNGASAAPGTSAGGQAS